MNMAKLKPDASAMADKKDIKEMPEAAEFGKMRSYLAKGKIPQSTIKNVIGEDVNNQTREEIVNKLRAYLRQAPKAK